MSKVVASVPNYLKLYMTSGCPYAHRANLALREVQAQVEYFQIDLKAKPSWYATKVNPAGKVPVLQVGKDEEQNSKFPESLVILELVAELYKDSDNSIYPVDAFARAEARGFIERFDQIIWMPYLPIFRGIDTTNAPAVIKGFEEVVEFLSRHKGPFFLGEKLTFADLAVAPFLGLIFMWGKHSMLDDGGVYETLTSDAKFKPLLDYVDHIQSRPSWKESFNEEEMVAIFKQHFIDLKSKLAK